MKYFKRKMFFVLIGLLLCFPMQSFAKETSHEGNAVRYVALGDSLAAGQTPYGGFGPSYANYIAANFQKEHVPVTLTNDGVSGFTTDQLREAIRLNKKEQAQIHSANLITIDIGANDLLGVLKTNQAQVPATIQHVGKNLHLILATIHNMNPRAQVYVMGYYNPFPYLPSAQQAPLLAMLHGLNQVIQQDALMNGDTYVPTEQTINKMPFVYIPNPQNIHLSPAGYKAVAWDFWKAIGD
jgi:lysophospholipase L1-like esterase